MSSETRAPLAVALHYNGRGAPRVVAKGRGRVGARILEAAEAHGVPMERNPALAEALSRVELEDEIPAPLYVAVAEILGFLMRASAGMPKS